MNKYEREHNKKMIEHYIPFLAVQWAVHRYREVMQYWGDEQLTVSPARGSALSSFTRYDGRAGVDMCTSSFEKATYRDWLKDLIVWQQRLNYKNSRIN